MKWLSCEVCLLDILAYLSTEPSHLVTNKTTLTSRIWSSCCAFWLSCWSRSCFCFCSLRSASIRVWPLGWLDSCCNWSANSIDHINSLWVTVGFNSYSQWWGWLKAWPDEQSSWSYRTNSLKIFFTISNNHTTDTKDNFHLQQQVTYCWSWGSPGTV